MFLSIYLWYFKTTRQKCEFLELLIYVKKQSLENWDFVRIPTLFKLKIIMQIGDLYL